MNVMNFYEVSNYKAERKLLKEIEGEKKFLTFKKLFKIFELNALLNAWGVTPKTSTRKGDFI